MFKICSAWAGENAGINYLNYCGIVVANYYRERAEL
jgi:hypothetical protein